MNPQQQGLGFFVVAGAILIVTGVLQAVVRPCRPHESTLQRCLNAAVLRAGVFVTVGVLSIMVGLGYIAIGF